MYVLEFMLTFVWTDLSSSINTFQLPLLKGCGLVKRL